MNTFELFESIDADMSNLTAVLAVVRKTLNQAENDIMIEGKTLRRANVEHASMLAYYDEYRVHLHSLSKFLDLRITQQRAKVLRMISETSQLSYGERMMGQLAAEDPTLTELEIKKLEVDEVLGLAASKVEAMKQRGYALKNITNLIVAQAQDEHLILNG